MAMLALPQAFGDVKKPSFSVAEVAQTSVGRASTGGDSLNSTRVQLPTREQSRFTEPSNLAFVGQLNLIRRTALDDIPLWGTPRCLLSTISIFCS
jgi:hypothetical protein